MVHGIALTDDQERTFEALVANNYTHRESIDVGFTVLDFLVQSVTAHVDGAAPPQLMPTAAVG